MKIFLSVVTMVLIVLVGAFFTRRYMVNEAQMLICYNAGTLNKCTFVSRLKYQRDGWQDSFWVGCMNGLNMADGKGPTKEKSQRCFKQYMKVRDK